MSQWLKEKSDLTEPIDVWIYTQMEKWVPNKNFIWYMSHICYLYDILYI